MDSLLVKDDIYWVGALDFDIKTFDIVMHTDFGTTYNSYVVKGSEKIALIETAKLKFFDEYISRLNSVCDVKDIDYIIVNHTEPDHSGSIEKLLELNPDITLVGSPFAIRFVGQIINKDFNSITVKEGDELSLGNKTFKFLHVPFLHWPDTMYSYLIEDKTLFTCDSFGAHYCCEEVFNDCLDLDSDEKLKADVLEAYKYYFDCIMGPFKDQMQKALAKIDKLEIDIICPGHGLVLRKDLDKYIDLYREWSRVSKINKIVVVYVSSYGYTKELAEEIASGIKDAGEVILYDLEQANLDNVLVDLEDAKGLLIGSPTIADDALPPIWGLLTSLNPNINKGLVAGVFGSYGWNGLGITNVEDRLKNLRFKMPIEALKVQLKASGDELEKAFSFGEDFAKAVFK
ncbi:MAG: FprA family A-type flavoprotein [bacterium]